MNANAPANVFPIDHREAVSLRTSTFGHPGVVVWLTGLSGSGKSTIAREVERRLLARGVHAFVLDGDNLRTGLSAGLGFSPEDRAEYNRPAGEAAALLADAGVVVLCALISSYAVDRPVCAPFAPVCSTRSSSTRRSPSARRVIPRASMRGPGAARSATSPASRRRSSRRPRRTCDCRPPGAASMPAPARSRPGSTVACWPRGRPDTEGPEC